MVTNLPAIGAPFVLQAAELAQLFPSLQRRGYQVVGPAVRGSAIVYDTLNSFEELPAGWTAEQEAGHYRLKRRDDGALFGYAVGAQGWKRFLYPAEARVFAAQRHGHGIPIPHPPPPPPGLWEAGVQTCALPIYSDTPSARRGGSDSCIPPRRASSRPSATATASASSTPPLRHRATPSWACGPANWPPWPSRIACCSASTIAKRSTRRAVMACFWDRKSTRLNSSHLGIS